MGSTDALPPVVVQVLGPLQLLVDDAPVDVRGPKRRAVLALLALAEGRIVPVDHLVDALWPSDPPESGRQSLHTHMSRLRTHFGRAAARIQTQHDGYRLDLDPDGVDVTRARALLAAARPNAEPDPARGYALLREAHALWRGPMLADLTDVASIATAVEGYERLHREVTDALISSAIDAGHPAAVLAEASASVAAEPLREPAVLLLMRALAAGAQAADALQIGRAYRHRLVEETGLDPSPALGRLERDIASGAAGPVPGRVATPPAEPRPSPESVARPVTGVVPGPATAGPTTRLFGRETQVAALHRLLAEQRIVTLVGPGGVGKSRVALEVAGPPGEATVLLLAPVTDPLGVPHALAAALNLSVVHGDVLAACLAVLGDRSGLLVVDNCEHLLDAVRDMVEAVLITCPGVTVLATSRERLGSAAEYAFRLAPLPLPVPNSDPPDRPGNDQSGPPPAVNPLQQVPSVAVFLDRAGRVRPGYLPGPVDLSLIADIVRRLDGMPLAIELAAGRLSSFSLTDLHRRLDRSLDLLGGGRPSGDARHRTLRATIEWSYDLLPEAEQRLFRHLAVFVDGIDLDAAEQLAADLGLTGDPGSVLAHLVDASMIDADLSAGTRYRMLETLRAFGLDRLVAVGEDEAGTALLLRWAVDVTARIGATMTTEREPEADAILRRELSNLRAAWKLARDRGNLDVAVSMVTALFDAVAYRDLVEIRSWAEDLADDPGIAAHPRRAAVWGTAAEAAYHRGDYQRTESLALSGLQAATADPDSWFCHSALSVLFLARGAWADVIAQSTAAHAETTVPRENLGIAALAMAYSGDLDGARGLNDRGLAEAVSPTMLSWGDYVAGEIDAVAGRVASAEQHYERSITRARSSGATFLVGVGTVGLLSVQVAAGRIHEALIGYHEVVTYFARTGNWTHLWTTLRNLATLLRRLGDDETADLLDSAADLAPDAPTDSRSRDTFRAPTAPTAQVPSRSVVLEAARRAIDRHLQEPP